MSRGGRGGGRGRGTNKSFSREQLSSLGVGNNEVLPGPVTQPPPLFPVLDHKPIGLNITIETKYLLMLKQDFVDHIQSSPAHIKLAVKDDSQEVQAGMEPINKMLSQPVGKNSFDWAMFPSELRPKMIAKKFKKPVPPASTNIKTETDIVDRLDKLEHLEKTTPLNTTVKQEVADEEDENEMVLDEDEEDEEMDDGTDYANNYFDNGEAYEDEDDALEDGPIY
ncbi:DNA-directed RNA polymerase III subunit RPC7 [Atheta coriaria]|uniref:DNA-directed RNA polymerase III subunit RPC7 n=1 Tax=Dalotia coriaria TaxID=877792 RepID=UPI0031F443DF